MEERKKSKGKINIEETIAVTPKSQSKKKNTKTGLWRAGGRREREQKFSLVLLRTDYLTYYGPYFSQHEVPAEYRIRRKIKVQ